MVPRRKYRADRFEKAVKARKEEFEKEFGFIFTADFKLNCRPRFDFV